MKKSLVLLSLFCTLLAIMACMVGQAAAQQNATQTVQASMANIWTARAGDIDAIVQDTTARLSTYTGPAAQSLADDLRAARSEFLRLSSLYQISRGHPTEQLTLVQQMRTVQQRIKKRFAPLESIADTITARLEEITALQKDLGDISQGMDADAIAPATTEDTGLNAYKRSLNEAKKTLTSAAAKLRTILTPARTIIARFDQDIANIEDNLGSVWESYYTTPSGISLDALVSIPAQLTDWVSSLNSRMVFAYPQSNQEWAGAAIQFAIAALGMSLLAYLALQGAHRLPDPWRTSLKTALKHSWVGITLGLSILLASANRYGGIYFGFVLIGSLILIAGVASLSWRLRIAAIPSLEDEPSPLRRLYLPAAFGVFMLFSDLPLHVLAVLWAVVMLTFLGAIHTGNRTHKNEDVTPLLERIFYGSTVGFGYASLLGALGGFARLAILLFVFHFALFNIITLGSALAGLASILAEKLFGKNDMPVRKALTEAVGIPLAWLFSLLCALPWLWAVPGARYVITHALSANYTVGEASFDFSKLLFILLLFFLFRSFIDLSKTSLEHLPERLPSMERGVIPPLRTLITYALWVIFAIIALGQVGVDFTSLAVVAGGLSVGIGFGMQNVFNNLVSGLMLIFGRSILVGDYVEVAGASGTVRAINIRSTIIETPERAHVYVPNSAIMSGQLTNWTRNSRIVRRTLNIGAAYGSDTALVMRLLLQAAEEQRHILKTPAPVVYLNNFGDSSLDFSMNVFIDDFNNAASAMSGLRLTVERLFNEHGIDIPFPQMALHMPAASDADNTR